MDEEISIINSNTRTEKIKNYLASNKKKILISILTIVIIIFAIFIFKEVDDRNKIKLSNQYYEATAAFENGDISKATNFKFGYFKRGCNILSTSSLFFNR